MAQNARYLDDVVIGGYVVPYRVPAGLAAASGDLTSQSPTVIQYRRDGTLIRRCEDGYDDTGAPLQVIHIWRPEAYEPDRVALMWRGRDVTPDVRVADADADVVAAAIADQLPRLLLAAIRAQTAEGADVERQRRAALEIPFGAPTPVDVAEHRESRRRGELLDARMEALSRAADQ
jgi:hypothetical protein